MISLMARAASCLRSLRRQNKSHRLQAKPKCCAHIPSTLDKYSEPGCLQGPVSVSLVKTPFCRCSPLPEAWASAHSRPRTHHAPLSLLIPILWTVIEDQEPQQACRGLSLLPQQLLHGQVNPSSKVNKQKPALKGTSLGPGTEDTHIWQLAIWSLLPFVQNNFNVYKLAV